MISHYERTPGRHYPECGIIPEKVVLSKNWNSDTLLRSHSDTCVNFKENVLGHSQTKNI